MRKALESFCDPDEGKPTSSLILFSGLAGCSSAQLCDL